MREEPEKWQKAKDDEVKTVLLESDRKDFNKNIQYEMPCAFDDQQILN